MRTHDAGYASGPGLEPVNGPEVDVAPEHGKSPERVGPPSAGWSKAYRRRMKQHLTDQRRKKQPPKPPRYINV